MAPSRTSTEGRYAGSGTGTSPTAAAQPGDQPVAPDPVLQQLGDRLVVPACWRPASGRWPAGSRRPGRAAGRPATGPRRRRCGSGSRWACAASQLVGSRRSAVTTRRRGRRRRPPRRTAAVATADRQGRRPVAARRGGLAPGQPGQRLPQGQPGDCRPARAAARCGSSAAAWAWWASATKSSSARWSALRLAAPRAGQDRPASPARLSSVVAARRAPATVGVGWGSGSGRGRPTGRPPTACAPGRRRWGRTACTRPAAAGRAPRPEQPATAQSADGSATWRRYPRPGVCSRHNCGAQPDRRTAQ